MVTRTVIPEDTDVITGDELLAMGNIGRSELVEGKIIYTSPTGLDHGNYEGNFYEKMKVVARQRKLGKVATREYFSIGVKLVWVADPKTASLLAEPIARESLLVYLIATGQLVV